MDEKIVRRRHRGNAPTGGDLGLTVNSKERSEYKASERTRKAARIARNRATKKS